jgi:hypothetical protein
VLLHVGQMDTPRRHVAHALLGQNDALLLLDEQRVQLQPVADLAEQHQPRVQRGGVGLGEVEVIDRLVQPGRGVGVGPKAQALALQHAHDLAVRHVCAATEGHVLQEVRQPLLLVALLQRAGAYAHAHGHAVLGRLVVLDGVAQPVGQPTEAHRGIGCALRQLESPPRTYGGQPAVGRIRQRLRRHQRQRQCERRCAAEKDLRRACCLVHSVWSPGRTAAGR